MPRFERIGDGVGFLSDPLPSAGSAAAGIWIPNGSRHESPLQAGFSHFVEHMLFKGGSRRGQSEIAKAIDRLGGYLNAFTEREYTCVHCVVPKGSLETALGIMIDMLEDSSFEPNEFEKERSVIVAEIEAGRDDPEEESGDLFMEALLPGQSLGRRIAGFTDDALRASRDDLYAFYEERYRKAPILITIAGGIDHDACASFCIRAFKHSAHGSAAPLVQPKPSWRKGIACFGAGQRQVHHHSARIVESVPRYEPRRLMSVAYGESMCSRLFQGIREEEGLCYSVYSHFTRASGIDMLGVYAACAPGSASKLNDALLSESDHLARQGLTVTELDDAKSHLLGSIILRADDSEYRMRRLARLHAEGYEDLSIEGSLARIRDVPFDEVNEAIGAFFHDAGEFSYWYGPERSIKRFADPTLSGGLS